jgi:hypothetical protein
MRVGFSWISLDSLVRIETYQWVTRLEARKLFISPFPWREIRRNGRPQSWHAEAQDCSWGKLNLVSDFLQEIVVRPIFLSPAGSRSRISLRRSEARTLKGDVWSSKRAPDHPPRHAASRRRPQEEVFASRTFQRFGRSPRRRGFQARVRLAARPVRGPFAGRSDCPVRATPQSTSANPAQAEDVTGSARATAPAMTPIRGTM